MVISKHAKFWGSNFYWKYRSSWAHKLLLHIDRQEENNMSPSQGVDIITLPFTLNQHHIVTKWTKDKPFNLSWHYIMTKWKPYKYNSKQHTKWDASMYPNSTEFLEMCRLFFPLLDSNGPLWSWSQGSWIYNYLWNQYLSPLTLRVRI
jgi:hypothetical protein